MLNLMMKTSHEEPNSNSNATWQDCQNWIQNHVLVTDRQTFIRSKKNADAYQVHKENVALKYQTMGDFILHTYFKIKPTKINDKGGSGISNCKFKVIITDEIAKTNQYVFVANNFPYDVEHGINHDLLFCVRPLNKQEIESIIEKELKYDTEYLWWVNPNHLQSIHNVWHCQILSRPKLSLVTSHSSKL